MMGMALDCLQFMLHPCVLLRDMPQVHNYVCGSAFGLRAGRRCNTVASEQDSSCSLLSFMGFTTLSISANSSLSLKVLFKKFKLWCLLHGMFLFSYMLFPLDSLLYKHTCKGYTSVWLLFKRCQGGQFCGVNGNDETFELRHDGEWCRMLQMKSCEF